MTPSNNKADPMTAAMDSMAALNPMQGGALKAMFTIGNETLQFLAQRMQQDIETQQALLGCKSLEDLQQVQNGFYTKAMDDYRRATAKMMAAVTAQGGGTTKRKYDDVPL